MNNAHTYNSVDEDILQGLFDPDATVADDQREQDIFFAKFGEKENQRFLVAHLAKNINGLLEFAASKLKPACFTEKAHQAMCQCAFDFFLEHGVAPPQSVIEHHIKTTFAEDKAKFAYLAEVKTALEIIDEYELPSSWMKNKVTEFLVQFETLKAQSKYLDSEKKMKDTTALAQRLAEISKMTCEDSKTYFIDDPYDIKHEWLVKDLMYTDSINCLYGESGSRKTFVGIDLAFSVATGTPFLNHFPVKKGKVLYVISEGAAAFKTRCEAWCEVRKVRPKNSFAFYPGSFDFNSEDTIFRMASLIDEKLGSADLIVVDTLSRNTTGDPDKNADMSKMLFIADRIKEETGATIIFVHHTGWSNTDRERGARALRDGVNCSISVTKDRDFSILSCPKQKDVEAFPDIAVKFQKVRVEKLDQDDMEASSLVGHYTSPPDQEVQGNQLHSMIESAYSIQETYSQKELVELLRNRWQGPAPGINRFRDLIEDEVGVTLERVQNGRRYEYRLLDK